MNTKEKEAMLERAKEADDLAANSRDSEAKKAWQKLAEDCRAIAKLAR